LISINFSKDGIYPVTVKGDLTIHGIKNNIEAPGVITIAQGVINASSKFTIKVKDYNIKIPALVINNIAEVIEITVNCKYDAFKRS